MPTCNIKYSLSSSTRADIREELIKLFLKEQPGTGSKNLASIYYYEVENFKSYKVVLKRPGVLNKGMDIEIMALGNNISFLTPGKKKAQKAPSHNAIISILMMYKNNHPSLYPQIKSIINDYFNCKNPTLNFNFPNYLDHKNTKRPIEIVLLCIKWLFIEQDITYWNWSGRSMLYNELKKNSLA